MLSQALNVNRVNKLFIQSNERIVHVLGICCQLPITFLSIRQRMPVSAICFNDGVVVRQPSIRNIPTHAVLGYVIYLQYIKGLIELYFYAGRGLNKLHSHTIPCTARVRTIFLAIAQAFHDGYRFTAFQTGTYFCVCGIGGHSLSHVNNTTSIATVDSSYLYCRDSKFFPTLLAVLGNFRRGPSCFPKQCLLTLARACFTHPLLSSVSGSLKCFFTDNAYPVNKLWQWLSWRIAFTVMACLEMFWFPWPGGQYLTTFRRAALNTFAECLKGLFANNTLLQSLDNGARFIMVFKVALLRAVQFIASCMQQFKRLTTSLTCFHDAVCLSVCLRALSRAELFSCPTGICFNSLTTMEAGKSIGGFTTCRCHVVTDPFVIGYSSTFGGRLVTKPASSVDDQSTQAHSLYHSEKEV